jgi:trimethylamine--corrinoid protein Co-methyltransferase
LSKIEINDETLALDLIDEAGPDGGFLDTAHTLRHYRERWYPRLIERGNYEQWLARGGQTMAERAAARVQEILETHRPQRLPSAVARRLRAVVEGAAA